jgi:hypothetical protein
MTRTLTSSLAALVLGLGLAAAPARAEMSDAEKAAAALAILGIAALAHHNQHYNGNYRPADGHQTAEFERGYRDGVHGYAYNSHNSTRHYAEGYQAGDRERENSMAHRRNDSANQAPHMATRGCSDIVAQNFAVHRRDVHITQSRSPARHEWLIEAAVGHQHMVCTMRDTGEVIDLRGGRL